jgi:hypothetical protein
LITNTVDYLRRNAIALTALSCALLALAAGSYAAVSLPAGSVGPTQLNHRLIGGYVRAWASVNAVYQLIGGSPGARVVGHPPQSGPTVIGWGRKFPRGCGVVTTPFPAGPGTPSLMANLAFSSRAEVFNQAAGVPDEGFTVAVIC